MIHDLFTNSSFLVGLFVLNGIFFLSWILIAAAMNSADRLAAQGFNKEYIKYWKSSTKSLLQRIGILFLLSYLIVSAVVYHFYHDYSMRLYVQYVFPFQIVSALTLSLLNTRKNNKIMRQLALQTGSDIVIDFNYRVLNTVFHPYIEAASSFIIVAVNCFLLKNHSIIYAYLFILWTFYLGLRFSRNFTGPTFRCQYGTLSKVILVYQGIIPLLILSRGMVYWETLTLPEVLVVSAVVLGGFGKFIYYCFNYPKLKRMIATEQA